MRSDNSSDDLRMRREKSIKDNEVTRLRDTYGERLARNLSVALELDLRLSDFSLAKDPPFRINWPPRIEDADGLVLAYISAKRASEALECADQIVAGLNGFLGVYGNIYLGLGAVQSLRLPKLLAAASSIEDSVVLYPCNIEGAIVVDCYPSNPGGAFSLLVQGDALVHLIASCFQERV